MITASLVDHMANLPRSVVSQRARQDAAVRYVLRMSNASGFNRVLRPHMNAATVRRCRMAMSNNAWFPLNFRLLAYRYAMTLSDPALQRACDTLGISEVDRRLIRRFVHENLPRLQRNAKVMYGGTVPHPEVVRRRCGEAVNEIASATKGIVNRRLRFIEVFNGVTREDLLGEVRARQIQQFYWSYTRDVDAGASPWLVTVASNTCKNLATHYSAKCRKSSTARDSTGISQLLIVSNVAVTADKSEVNLYDKAIDPAPSAESRVSAAHILQTLERIARSPKQRRFFEILVSDHDPEFDAWLGLRGLIRPNQSHADYRAKHGLDCLIDKISEMLSVHPSKPKRLLQEARSTLIAQGYE